MNETDLFNKDAMFWRELNFSLPANEVEVVLIEPIEVNGEYVQVLVCGLQPFETHMVEYDLDSGGSFMKNEVNYWPYVLLEDLALFTDASLSHDVRNAKLKTLPHSNVQSIAVKDESGHVIAKKERV
jgi:hypothetical protein